MTKKRKHAARKPQALNEHEATESSPSLEDRRESNKDPPSDGGPSRLRTPRV